MFCRAGSTLKEPDYTALVMLVIVQNATKTKTSAAKSTVRQNKSGQTKNKQQNNKNNKKENIVMAPTSMSSQFVNKSATISYSARGDGSVWIRHREFITDIMSIGVNFHTISRPINPGVGTTFEWLQAIANSYESYVFNSLSFEFESTCATTDRGTLIMGIDFDASDPGPATKQDLMAYQGSVRSNIWSHACCAASSKDLKKFGIQRYVRSSVPLSASSDIKTFDVGNLYVGLQGVSSQLAAGELYVTYDVTLHTPQPAGAALAYNYSARAVFNSSTSPAGPLGLGMSELTGGIRIEYRTNNSFFVRDTGQYLMYLNLAGSGMQSTDTVVLTVVNGTINALQSSDGANSGTNQLFGAYLINVLSSDFHITIGLFDVGTVTQTVVRLAPYPYILD